MTRYSPLLLILSISLFTPISWAGPDWRTIENAREAKKLENRQIAEAETRHQTGLEKLEAACKKAKADAELASICEEIISAYKELN